MNKGLTLQRDPFTDYSTEIAALVDLAPGTLVLLAFDLTFEAQRNHKKVVADYCAAHPGTRLIVRPYEPNIMSRNPIDWAKECKKRADFFNVPGAFVEVVPANELNVAVERGGSAFDANREDFGDQAAWLQAFAADWEALGSPYPLHCPALSPSGGYQQGMNIYAQNGVYADFDVVDLHVYAPGHLPDVDNIPCALGQPKAITEFNAMPPAFVFNLVDSKVQDAVWFLLGGTSDWAQDDLLKRPDDYTSFKNWQSGGTPVATNSPTPPTLEERIKALEAGVAQNLRQIGILTDSIKHFRTEKFAGAGSMDGDYCAIKDIESPDYAATYPKA